MKVYEKSTDWQSKKGGQGGVLEKLSISCTKYDMDMDFIGIKGNEKEN